MQLLQDLLELIAEPLAPLLQVLHLACGDRCMRGDGSALRYMLSQANVRVAYIAGLDGSFSNLSKKASTLCEPCSCSPRSPLETPPTDSCNLV